MTRVAIDQDIVPINRVVDSLPSSFESTVGLEHDEEALIETLTGVDVVIVTSRIPLTSRVIRDSPSLEIIAKLGTGIDNVDVEAARANDVRVTYTPGYNALSVAEHTLCLTLATCRRLTEARNVITRGDWRDSLPLGTRLTGSTVGIVGFGNIGKRLGSLLLGFNVDLLVTDPYVPELDAELVRAEHTSLDSVLERADIVCLTAELTDETEGLIGEPELARMSESTILINTARGPIVDQEALVDALSSEEIAGAGLDVYSEEPLSSDSALLDLENVVLTPHIGSMTLESRHKTIDQLVTNVELLMTDEMPSNQFLA